MKQTLTCVERLSRKILKYTPIISLSVYQASLTCALWSLAKANDLETEVCFQC